MARLVKTNQAMTDVIIERRRQQEQEGWTVQHDLEHDSGELAAAGCAYALYAADELNPHSQGDGQFKHYPPAMWPWHEEVCGRGEGPVKTEPVWWKPTDPRRALVKAAALIIAEIDRMDHEVKPDGR